MTAGEPTRSNAGWLWAWVPVALLSTMFIGLSSLAYIAIDDPTFALEPNYYDKAVHWNERQAQARESETLGFKLSLPGPLVISAGGKVKVELGVKDRGNVAVLGANVSLDAFPNAHADHVEQLTLRETSPGIYSGELSRGLRGLWELRVVVREGTRHYTEALRCDIAKGDAA